MPHMLAQRPRLLELALGCLCCVGASGDAQIPLISRRRSAACLVCSVRIAAISCFSSRLVGEAERERELKHEIAAMRTEQTKHCLLYTSPSPRDRG